MTADRPLLELREVSKAYGTLTGVTDVSVALWPGEVLCLLGDNGAGKTTLVKILSGAHRPSRGTFLVDGWPVAFRSPREALGCGIATVYQDLAMVPLMSVWRNFVLGAEPTRGRGPFRRLDVARCHNAARTELERIGIGIRRLSQPVGTLSGGERQALAIARALHAGARVLLLDEPTAALGVRQAGVVLRSIAEAKTRGVGVLLVTHNPQHAMVIGDRFLVLRLGRVVAQLSRDEARLERLVGLMGGGTEEEPFA